MAKFEVEVVGHFSATIEVEATTYEEAEILATQDFERDYLPYSSNHGWTDVWGWTEIEHSELIEGEEEEEEY